MWSQPWLLTIQLIAVSVTIATVVGILGAWSASMAAAGRTWSRLASRTFLISMVIALAMPLVLHAAAWEATAGKFGWLVLTQTGARDSSAPFGQFRGLLACGWIHGIFGSAIVALATWWGVSHTPTTVIDQSRLEMGPIAQWWRVRLPVAAPWVVASLVATAVLAAAEMTVADLYGFQTVADRFYLFYASDPTLGQIFTALLAPLLIAIAFLTWIASSRVARRSVQRDRDRSSGTISGTSESLPVSLRALGSLVALSIAALVVAIPITGLIVKAGQQVSVEAGVISTPWSMRAFLRRSVEALSNFSDEYMWTATLATATAVSAVALTWPMASAARTNRWLERLLDVSSVLLVVIPGPIVGVALIGLFQLPIPGFVELYQNSIVPTVLACLMRAGPASYWILRSGYRGLGDSVIEAARADVGWARRMWLIDRPIMSGSLMLAGLVAGLIAAGDVAATLPVIPAGVSTVGTRLFGLLHSGARYQEATLALWFVLAIVAISLVLVRAATGSRVRVEK